MRMKVRSLASLGGLRIQPCCELWCRLQAQLGSCFAVAVVLAGSYSSDLTPSLVPMYAAGAAHKINQNQTKKKECKV